MYLVLKVLSFFLLILAGHVKGSVTRTTYENFKFIIEEMMLCPYNPVLTFCRIVPSNLPLMAHLAYLMASTNYSKIMLCRDMDNLDQEIIRTLNVLLLSLGRLLESSSSLTCLRLAESLQQKALSPDGSLRCMVDIWLLRNTTPNIACCKDKFPRIHDFFNQNRVFLYKFLNEMDHGSMDVSSYALTRYLEADELWLFLLRLPTFVKVNLDPDHLPVPLRYWTALKLHVPLGLAHPIYLDLFLPVVRTICEHDDYRETCYSEETLAELSVYMGGGGGAFKPSDDNSPLVFILSKLYCNFFKLTVQLGQVCKDLGPNILILSYDHYDFSEACSLLLRKISVSPFCKQDTLLRPTFGAEALYRLKKRIKTLASGDQEDYALMERVSTKALDVRLLLAYLTMLDVHEPALMSRTFFQQFCLVQPIPFLGHITWSYLFSSKFFDDVLVDFKALLDRVEPQLELLLSRQQIFHNFLKFLVCIKRPRYTSMLLDSVFVLLSMTYVLQARLPDALKLFLDTLATYSAPFSYQAGNFAYLAHWIPCYDLFSRMRPFSSLDAVSLTSLSKRFERTQYVDFLPIIFALILNSERHPEPASFCDLLATWSYLFKRHFLDLSP